MKKQLPLFSLLPSSVAPINLTGHNSDDSGNSFRTSNAISKSSLAVSSICASSSITPSLPNISITTVNVALVFNSDAAILVNEKSKKATSYIVMCS